MSDYEFTAETLKEFQAEPLFPDKYQRSLAKISEAYSMFDNRIVVSYSGGKDSNVLADMTAQWCKIKQCPLNIAFCNTGLEYPEIQKHVPRYADYLKGKYGIDVNLAVLRPEMRFDEVISTSGYPIISKEVAEAIYYARRIRFREVREDHRYGNQERENGSGQNCMAKEGRAYGKQAEWKRTELRGGEKHRLAQTSTARNRRTILLGKMPGAGVTAERNTDGQSSHENSAENTMQATEPG